jgi:hypothetical protein
MYSKGPIFGRFIHFFVSAPKFHKHNRKLAGGLPQFSADRRQRRTGSEFKFKSKSQITER